MKFDSSTYEYKELRECIDIIIDHRGKTPKKLNSDWVKHGIPTISAKNVHSGKLVAQDSIRHVTHKIYEKWMKDKVKSGDCLLVSEGATLGECLYWDSDYPIVLGQRIFCIRTKPDILYPRFFYAYMTSAEFQSEIIGRATGSSVPGLRQTEVLKLKVKLLPMENQIFIGDLLYSINKKIEINSETNKILEEIAQAIFKSWFVNFEPTRAKIAARERWLALHEVVETSSPTCYSAEFDNANQPTQTLEEAMAQAAMAAISGKTPEELEQLSLEQQQNLRNIAALFPDTLVDSELGEMPKGWNLSEIGNEVTVVGGGTPSTSNPEFWDNGDISWTSPKDMSNLTDKILIQTDRKITTAGLAKISSGLLPVNTVLMSSRAPVGYLAIAKIPVAINQGYIAMRCEKILSPEFVVQWADSVMDEIKQRASGTTFAEISKKNFKVIPVIVPEPKIVDQYSAIVGGLYEKITASLLEIQVLTETRDSLLPKLLSGQLKVHDAENAVTEAMA